MTMELRWDPMLGEWVMVSSTRRNRPWQPSGFCPFCPGAPETGYGWEILVLENRYPMLSPDAPQPAGHWFYRVGRSYGKCLIIVETPEHNIDDLSDLPVMQIKKILDTVRSLTTSGREEGFEYLLWFRNKGSEIGVSLAHPHSQVYILPFIPSRIEREMQNAKAYMRENGRCLVCTIAEVEEKDSIRVLLSGNKWISFMPFYAHWPFEIHIVPRRHVLLFSDLGDEEILDLALSLKLVLCGLKKLFSKPSPYILVLHQAPLKSTEEYSYYHLHIEIYGIMRDEGKLKYAAGMETGGGNFTYDSTPEENALKLRASIENCSKDLGK